ncbi:MAG: epoxide hydrolase [Steroidobacteraceae bacterium]
MADKKLQIPVGERSNCVPERFEIRVPDERIEDLKDRLRRTRFAPDVGPGDWTYGTPTAVLKDWVDAWLQFDWRKEEARMNAFENYRATVDGSPIHFIHRKGKGPNPMPIVLCHGWPWTFWDWHETIDRLADPAKYGGDAADAFDVVVPSLPGYTFSPLARTGLGLTQIADLIFKLMTESLGYERFAAAGGDQGNFISGQLGHKYADRVIGIHLLGAIPMLVFSRSENPLALPKDWGFVRSEHNPKHPVLTAPVRQRRHLSAHLIVNALEPQTISAAMHDSPVGLLSWMLDRRRWWSDNNGDVLQSYSREFLLTTFSLYWYTDTFATSVRTYYESAWSPWRASHARSPVVEAPTGITFLDRDENTSHSRFWCEDFYNLKRASFQTRGGHFGPSEVPQIVVSEIQETFRALR